MVVGSRTFDCDNKFSPGLKLSHFHLPFLKFSVQARLCFCLEYPFDNKLFTKIEAFILKAMFYYA